MSGRIRASIHQPNYLPWLGFFHKIRHSDVFVLLDDVQLQKKQGSWTNRTRLCIHGEDQWITIPVNRPSGTQLIKDVQIANETWLKSHRRTIEINYKVAPYFSQLRELLDHIFSVQTNALLAFNLNAIFQILNFLGRDEQRKLVMSSSFGVSTTGTDRLIDIVRACGANEYMTGMGADGYLEPEKFEQDFLQLVVQDFQESERPQLRTAGFVPGLSILDALMMVGVDQVNSLLDGNG